MAEAVAADKRAAEDDLQGNYKRFKVTVEGGGGLEVEPPYNSGGIPQ